MVSRKGYADTTIADLAGEAHVSRRTFYEHFDSKAECLIALYEAASEVALDVLKASIQPSRPWESQVEHALRAYLGSLASNPVLLATLFIAILHMGPQGLAARRRVNRQLADFIVGVVNPGCPSGAELPEPMAMAIVGGVNELVLDAIERGATSRLVDLAPMAAAVARAVIVGARAAAGSNGGGAGLNRP